MTYWSQGRWKEAEELEVQVMEVVGLIDAGPQRPLCRVQEQQKSFYHRDDMVNAIASLTLVIFVARREQIGVAAWMVVQNYAIILW